MKYIVRLNPKAWNPITRKIMPDRLWEVEQVATKDSGQIKWQGAEVRVDGHPVRELFRGPLPGKPPWEMACYGICVRGYDDALEIRTGPHDASGN